MSEEVSNSPEREPKQKVESLRVFVRVRPKLRNETVKEDAAFAGTNGTGIKIVNNGRIFESDYHKVFDRTSSQEEVYDEVEKSVLMTISGINCTIFAYGQTGSGKTHTMFGPFWEYYPSTRNILYQSITMSADLMKEENSDDLGIICRSIQSVFADVNTKDEGKNHTIYCSFLQIYNEKLYDLLQDAGCEQPLLIRENKYQGIYVEGLTEYVVTNVEDTLTLLARGGKARRISKTKHNVHSSRSHTIFQIQIEDNKIDKNGMYTRAKLNLCDLAGSEKLNKDDQTVRSKGTNQKSSHFQELTTINQSLTSLGKVISALSQKRNHIPFRDSKITRLLQDSIGGTTHTIVIGTISPCLESADESVSTLNFCDRAKKVEVKAKINTINAGDDALVQQLYKEVKYLRDLLHIHRKGGIGDVNRIMLNLKQENARLRQFSSKFQEVESLKSENKIMKIELQKRTTREPNSPKSVMFYPNSGSESTGVTSNPGQSTTIPNFYMNQDPPGFFPSKNNLTEMAHQHRFAELDKAASELRETMSSLNRCPICTLQIPCKHFDNLEKLQEHNQRGAPRNPPEMGLNRRPMFMAGGSQYSEQNSERFMSGGSVERAPSHHYNKNGTDQFMGLSNYANGDNIVSRSGSLGNSMRNSGQLQMGKPFSTKSSAINFGGGSDKSVTSDLTPEISIRVRGKQGAYQIHRGSLISGIKKRDQGTMRRNQQAFRRLQMIQDLERRREISINQEMNKLGGGATFEIPPIGNSSLRSGGYLPMIKKNAYNTDQRIGGGRGRVIGGMPPRGVGRPIPIMGNNSGYYGSNIRKPPLSKINTPKSQWAYNEERSNNSPIRRSMRQSRYEEKGGATISYNTSSYNTPNYHTRKQPFPAYSGYTSPAKSSSIQH